MRDPASGDANCVSADAAHCGAGNGCPQGYFCDGVACRNLCSEGVACLPDQICVGQLCIGTDKKHDSAAVFYQTSDEFDSVHSGGGTSSNGLASSGSNGSWETADEERYKTSAAVGHAGNSTVGTGGDVGTVNAPIPSSAGSDTTTGGSAASPVVITGGVGGTSHRPDAMTTGTGGLAPIGAAIATGGTPSSGASSETGRVTAAGGTNSAGETANSGGSLGAAGALLAGGSPGIAGTPPMSGGGAPNDGGAAETGGFDGGLRCAPRTPVASPPASNQHGMTYFKPTKETLLVRAEGESMRLYAFKYPDRVWTRVNVTGAAPSARVVPVFEYDESTDNAVLYGGDNGAPMSDLWEFDGCQWINRTPVTLPSSWPGARWAAAAAFDHANGHLMITTGFTIPLSSWTWERGVADATVFEWHTDTGTFNVFAPLGSPPSPRGGAVATSDPSRKIVFFAAGVQSSQLGDSQVYRWNGASGQWTSSNPSPSLTDRLFAAIYRDPIADRVIVTGGQFIGWLWKPDYYQYNPDSDQFSVLGPDAIYNRFWAPIAYDSDDNVAIQFSGFLGDPMRYGNSVAPAPADTRIIASGGVVTTLVAP